MICCLTACESWLDVSPKSQVKDKDLFADEAGFQTAMFGVYTSMASASLYGAELTMGFMDVLARYYDVPSGQRNYFQAYSYNYTSDDVKGFCDAFWLQMYKTIMNCNHLLANLEGSEALFSRGHHAAMKGEMLGVRAYLHFDLLRMFAPSYAVGSELPGIPYVDRVSRSPFPHLTVKEATARIIADCEASLAALKTSDPWVTAGTEEVDDRFFEQRRERMNYYAVKALLARVQLYAGNTAEAGRLADELVKTKGLGILSPLFSLYSDKTTDRANDFFALPEDGTENFTVSDKRRGSIFEAAKYTDDTRVLGWMTERKGTTTPSYLFTKYERTALVPLIRMCEMYYICAECCGDEARGLDLLNEVRQNCAIPSQLDLVEGQCDFRTELLKEYRKSFMGEGQFFYYLKRTDAPQIPTAEEVEYPRRVYVLPMPEGELEFGDFTEL